MNFVECPLLNVEYYENEFPKTINICHLCGTSLFKKTKTKQVNEINGAIVEFISTVSITNIMMFEFIPFHWDVLSSTPTAHESPPTEYRNRSIDI